MMVFVVWFRPHKSALTRRVERAWRNLRAEAIRLGKMVNGGIPRIMPNGTIIIKPSKTARVARYLKTDMGTHWRDGKARAWLLERVAVGILALSVCLLVQHYTGFDATMFGMIGATRYWVGGSGAWSDGINHWAAVSGGSPDWPYQPNGGDTCVFDGSSGGTITLDVATPSITLSHQNASSVFSGGSDTLYITLNGSSSLTGTSHGGLSVYFDTASASLSVTSTTTIGYINCAQSSSITGGHCAINSGGTLSIASGKTLTIDGSNNITFSSGQDWIGTLSGSGTCTFSSGVAISPFGGGTISMNTVFTCTSASDRTWTYGAIRATTINGNVDFKCTGAGKQNNNLSSNTITINGNITDTITSTGVPTFQSALGMIVACNGTITLDVSTHTDTDTIWKCTASADKTWTFKQAQLMGTIQANTTGSAKVTVVPSAAGYLGIKKLVVTTGKLALTAGYEYQLKNGETSTVAASSELRFVGTGVGTEVTLNSQSAGSTWLLNRNASGTVTVSYCIVKDSDASSGSAIDATDGTNTNNGNNTNWSFVASRYWVAGGTTDWNSTTNWSTSDGGASGASVPTAGMVANFTNLSGAGNCVVNVDTAALAEFNSSSCGVTISQSGGKYLKGIKIDLRGLTVSSTLWVEVTAGTGPNLKVTNGTSISTLVVSDTIASGDFVGNSLTVTTTFTIATGKTINITSPNTLYTNCAVTNNGTITGTGTFGWICTTADIYQSTNGTVSVSSLIIKQDSGAAAGRTFGFTAVATLTGALNINNASATKGFTFEYTADITVNGAITDTVAGSTLTVSTGGNFHTLTCNDTITLDNCSFASNKVCFKCTATTSKNWTFQDTSELGIITCDVSVGQTLTVLSGLTQVYKWIVTAGTLKLTSGKTYKMKNAEDSTVATGAFFDVSGAILRSIVDGSVWNLTRNSGATVTTSAATDVKDSNASSGLLISAIGAANSGNNTYWRFGALTIYWVPSGGSGTGNWSDDDNHWALTTGGTAKDGNIPIDGDTVVFDGSSGTGTCTLNVDSAKLAGVSSTGSNITLAQTGAKYLFSQGTADFRGVAINASFNFQSYGGATIALFTNSTELNSLIITDNCEIRCNPLIVNGAWTVALGKSCTINTSYSVRSMVAFTNSGTIGGSGTLVVALATADINEVSPGTLNINTQIALLSTATGSRKFTIGAATSINGSLELRNSHASNGLTFEISYNMTTGSVIDTIVSAGTITISVITSSKTWTVQGDMDLSESVINTEYLNISLEGSGLNNYLTLQDTSLVGTVTGKNAIAGINTVVSGLYMKNFVVTLGTLKFSAGKTYYMKQGETSTIAASQTLSCVGTGLNKITLRSQSDGTAWLLNRNAIGTATVQYVNVKDSDASGGSSIDATDGTSIDAGNNTNWLWPAGGYGYGSTGSFGALLASGMV